MSGRSELERSVAASRRALIRTIGGEIARLREDAGVSRAALARASGVDPGYLLRIEAGEREASLSTLLAVGHGLGADVRVRFHPNDGPRLRDRFQAPMIEAVVAELHARVMPYPEVPVLRPVRGTVDLVLHDPVANLLIAVEAESMLRRLEQQLRWSAQKADALRHDPRWRSAQPRISRILLLRATAAHRELARAAPATLAAAFPAAPVAALASLRGTAPWPGDTMLWVSVQGGSARIGTR